MADESCYTASFLQLFAALFVFAGSVGLIVEGDWKWFDPKIISKVSIAFGSLLWITSSGFSIACYD